MPTEKKKSSRGKRSKRLDQENGVDTGSSNFQDVINDLGESVPTDNETDLLLSRAILNIAGPFVEKYDNKDQHVRTIIDLAVAAWNLAVVPKSFYEAATKNVSTTLPADSTLDEIESILSIVLKMFQYKIKYYSDKKYYIDRYEVFETDTGWNLRVLSTIMIRDKSECQ